MKEQLSDIICIVDRSGSMAQITSDAIGGFNTFLQAQKEEPGEARLSLVLFDHEYLLVHDAVPIATVPPLTGETYVPRGTTALLDAIGRTIAAVGERLAATPEPERPGKVIVAILTDGLENASREYTHERISEMIRHQREEYAWEFVFLAANQDAIAAAVSLSINAKDAYSFDASADGIVAAYARMSEEVSFKRRMDD
jgi:uncharacterized protein YegL